jgi:putative NADH-flavin reductase
MNITLFGANGSIGKIVTKHALEHGDIVTTYVRRMDHTTPSHNDVIVVVGDLSNQLLIEKAIEKADVVISTLGPALDMSRENTGTPIADGHERIIHAMEKLNKKRFSTLATPSIHSEEDRKHLWIILPPIMAQLLYPNGYREMKKIEQIIKTSSLDWTVVRIINPNVKHTRFEYHVSLGDKPIKMSVSRENVGAFMYRVASEHLYIKQMPIVFN